MEPHAETLESPALIQGSIEVVERKAKRERRLRGTTVKRYVARHLYALLTRAPAWLVSAYARYAAAWANVVAGMPKNRLLESCRYVSILAARHGIRHTPRGIYRRFVDGAVVVVNLGFALFREGHEAMAERIHVPDADVRHLAELVEEHGGVMFCVPHNAGAVFSSTVIARGVKTVLVSRNSPTVDRTKIALDIYERMDMKVLMVRDANPIELARVCLRLLRENTLVAATVDRIDRQPTRTMVPMFGQPVGFGMWAAKFAVRSKVPLVPVYIHTRRDRLELEVGPGLITTDVREGMEHYLRFFEAKVLEDPSSWSFLADRRWRWVLGDGVRGRPDSDGGLVRPDKPRKTGA